MNQNKPVRSKKCNGNYPMSLHTCNCQKQETESKISIVSKQKSSTVHVKTPHSRPPWSSVWVIGDRKNVVEVGLWIIVREDWTVIHVVDTLDIAETVHSLEMAFELLGLAEG